MTVFWSCSSVGCFAIIIITLLISIGPCAGILLHRVLVHALKGDNAQQSSLSRFHQNIIKTNFYIFTPEVSVLIGWKGLCMFSSLWSSRPCLLSHSAISSSSCCLKMIKCFQYEAKSDYFEIEIGFNILIWELITLILASPLFLWKLIGCVLHHIHLFFVVILKMEKQQVTIFQTRDQWKVSATITHIPQR